jgi:phosphatidylserine/phosphatidylglycerophosphate/cardiolipin synthase-like enzyme
MALVQVRSYLSPTLVLLALDWPEGAQDNAFLGFAIKRTPGFRDPATLALAVSSWLPNRIAFNGPPAAGQPDFPSNLAPVQKFMWWDARIDVQDRGAQFTYEVWPMRGDPTAPQPVNGARAQAIVRLPQHVENGIGTYFNRAVVSSQAFSRKLKAMGLDPKKTPPAAQALTLRKWLGNDLEGVVPDFIGAAAELAGAIYHLTDDLWVIPALRKAAQANKKTTLVYDGKTTKDKQGNVVDSPNQKVVDELGTKITFKLRDKTAIMHNKFLVSGGKLMLAQAAPATVVCGSANYTTEGLTEQANLMHTFDSAALAQLYLNRMKLIAGNPTLGKTAAQNSGWSDTVTVGDAGVRAFYSPEPTNVKKQIETIVQAIHGANSSVLFCLFSPTDKDLRDACFSAGDNGLMMFGLVNAIAEPKATSQPLPADQLAQLELYHRSRDQKDVIPAAYFHDKVPAGFEPEVRVFPGAKLPPYPPVIIHHKFIVIDAETTSPTIYTGSANMSANSVNHNDENLLEIKGSRRLAGIYLAEFLRLYEHYRARAHYIANQQGTTTNSGDPFQLRGDSSWATKAFKPGTPEYRCRVHMAAVV